MPSTVKRHAQPQLDRLHRSYAGLPANQVRSSLAAAFKKYGWQADAATLRSYAEQISVGRPVALDLKRVRV